MQPSVREDVLDAIKDRLEPLEVIELLGLSVNDLIEAFEEQLNENLSKVLEYIDYEPDDEQPEY